MNDADKKKLIAEIVSDSKNFELSLHDKGRVWFVDQLIRSLESTVPPTPDAQIPARVREIVIKTKALVAAKEAIPLKIPLERTHKSWHGSTRPRRIEAIYGVIAADPSLVEPAADKYLDLAIRRRYRTIARMELWVSFPLVRYPDAMCNTYKINNDAEPHWDVALPLALPNGGDLPRWTLKTAPASVVPAVEKLWTTPVASCDGNVLECATAMTTVLIDSLLETRDPNAFLRAVHARAPLYLAICNPTGDLPNFVQDDDPRRVFTTTHGSIDDLQIGDYVYVFNHPLYLVFEPGGFFSGEHAVVTGCFNRDPLKGFEISGHGVPPKTIHALHQDLLKHLQTTMDRLFVIAAAFLDFIKAPVAAPDVIFHQQPVMVGDQPHDTHFYLFDRQFTYRNFNGTTVRAETERRYLIVYIPDLHQMGLHDSTDMDIARANPGAVIPLVLFTSVPPEEELNPIHWGIPYKPHFSETVDHWPLFRRDNGTLTVNLIEARDMPDPPLGRNFNAVGVRRIGPNNRPTPAGAI